MSPLSGDDGLFVVRRHIFDADGKKKSPKLKNPRKWESRFYFALI